MSILFICLGNVARSQMAEAFFNHLSSARDALSAGCLDFTPAKYCHPVEEVITVMQEEGIDVSAQKVKFVTPAMTKAADQIIVLCNPAECPGFITGSSKTSYWQIRDPFGSGLDNYRNIRNQIKHKVIKLIATNSEMLQ